MFPSTRLTGSNKLTPAHARDAYGFALIASAMYSFAKLMTPRTGCTRSLTWISELPNFSLHASLLTSSILCCRIVAIRSLVSTLEPTVEASPAARLPQSWVS